MGGTFNFVESLHGRISDGRWAGSTTQVELASFKRRCEVGRLPPLEQPVFYVPQYLYFLPPGPRLYEPSPGMAAAL
eukprot:12908653-Prorocentrum_lima.AAC.1